MTNPARNLITEQTCNAIEHALLVEDTDSLAYTRRYNKARKVWNETAKLAPRYANIDFDDFLDEYLYLSKHR